MRSRWNAHSAVTAVRYSATPAISAVLRYRTRPPARHSICPRTHCGRESWRGRGGLLTNSLVDDDRAAVGVYVHVERSDLLREDAGRNDDQQRGQGGYANAAVQENGRRLGAAISQRRLVV